MQLTVSKFFHFLKYVLYSFLFSCVFFLLVVAGILYFVDPNQFKPLLVRIVYKETGSVLQIQGDLHWSKFPELGLRIENAELIPEVPGQENLATLGEATVSFRLLPLLIGRISLSQLDLDNLNINLIRGTSGRYNWARHLVVANQNTVNHENEALDIAKKENLPPFTAKWIAQLATFLVNFNHASLSLSNITVNWEDKSTNCHAVYHLDKLESSQLNLRGEYFPLEIKGSIALPDESNKLQLDLHTYAAIDLSKAQMVLADLVLQLNNLVFLGKATLSDFYTKPTYLLKLKGSHLNFDEFLSQMHWFDLTPIGLSLDNTELLLTLTGDDRQLNATPIVLKTGAGTFNITGNYIFQPAWKVKLNLKADKLLLNGVNIEDLGAIANIDPQVMRVSSLNASVGTGRVVASFLTEYAQDNPSYQLQLTGTALPLQAVSQLFGLSSTGLTGMLNIKAALNSTGDTQIALLENINGQSQLVLQQLLSRKNSLLRTIESVLPIKKNPPLPEKSTTGNLSANFQIKKGIASTRDLKMDSDFFSILGKGSVNLRSTALNFQLKVHLLHTFTALLSDAVQVNLSAGLPLEVHGTVSKPTIFIDPRLVQGLLDPKVWQKQINSLSTDLKKQGKKIEKFLQR